MKPKSKGGLGVINLSIQNDALLLKHLHKFYNRLDIPWVPLVWSKHYTDKVPHASREVSSFRWKDVQRLSTLYRGLARCAIRDGKSVTFWVDLWSDHILAHQFPNLFASAWDGSISVHRAMQAEDLDSLFILPLSQEALQEFQELADILVNQDYDDQVMDTWSYQWGNSYTSRKFYKSVFQNLPAHPIFEWMWKSKCTPRVKFFAWLVLVDRLNTKTMLKRRNISNEDEPLCVTCNERRDEDIEHLFFSCEFAKS